MREAADVQNAVHAYPLDRVDEDNIGQYIGFHSRKLLINRCDDCQAWHQPPHPICPRCWSEALTPTEVSGRGTVYLVTVLRQGRGVEQGRPYPVVTVELEEQCGLRFTASMVDCGHVPVAVGQSVELAWTDRAGAPWPAFRLSEEA